MPKQPPPPPKRLKARFLYLVKDPNIKTPYITSRSESYPIGESPFEHLLKIYPVAFTIVSNLTTIDHLTIRQVSKTCRAYFDNHHSRQLNQIALVKDIRWFSRFRKLQGVEEKLERDGMYRFMLEYYYKRKLEDRAILKMKRAEYRREVVYLLKLAGQFMPKPNGLPSSYSPEVIETEDWASEEEDPELYSYPGLKDVNHNDYNSDTSSYVSSTQDELTDRDEDLFLPGGTKRAAEKTQKQPNKKLFKLPKRFALPPITERTAIYQVESSHPWQYFYKGIGSGFLERMLTSLKSEGKPLYEKITVMILDGTNIDEAGLRACLDSCPQITSLSVRGCARIHVGFWVKWLEDMIIPKTKCGEYQGYLLKRGLRLKWLKVYPSGNFPTNAFSQGRTPWDNRPEAEKFRFVTAMSFIEHRMITLPLILSLHPLYSGHGQDPISTMFSRYTSIANHLFESYRMWMNDGFLRGEGWFDSLVWGACGPISRLMALGAISQVCFDFTYCACGDHCFSFVRGSVNLNGSLPNDPSVWPSHKLAVRFGRALRGGQKCAGCGVWEWEIEKRPNTCTDPNYRVQRQQYKGQLYFGTKVLPSQGSTAFSTAEAAMTQVGGVKLVKIIGLNDTYSPNDPDSDKYIGVGLGAGNICEECEQNMTCWSCGKFYCQICLFGPGPHVTANKEPTWIERRLPMPMPARYFPVHGLQSWVANHMPTLANANPQNPRLIPAPLLIHTCKKGKHGPLCWDCKPNWCDECDNCRGNFCKICNTGGIQLDTADKENNEDLGPVEEDWEKDDMPAEEGGYEGVGDWGIYRNDYKLSQHENYWGENDLPSDAEIDGRPIGEVTKEAREDRERILKGQLRAEYVEDDVDMESDGQTEEGDELERQQRAPDTIEGSPQHDGCHFTPWTTEHDNFIRACNFPPIPDIREFSDAPRKHDTELREAMENLGTLKADLEESGYKEILIYSKCEICMICICKVCSRGEDSWERCGGCGKKCCPKCVFQLCDVCERALCERCFERENVSEMYKAMPRTPVPRFNPWAEQVGYYRNEIPDQGPPGPVMISDPEICFGKFKDGGYGYCEEHCGGRCKHNTKGKAKDVEHSMKPLTRLGPKQKYATSEAESGADYEASLDGGEPLVWGYGFSDEESSKEGDDIESNERDTSDNISFSMNQTPAMPSNSHKATSEAKTPAEAEKSPESCQKRKARESRYERNLEKFLKRIEEDQIPGNTLESNEQIDEDFCARCELRRRIGFVRGEGYWEKEERQTRRDMEELARKGIHLRGVGYQDGYNEQWWDNNEEYDTHMDYHPWRVAALPKVLEEVNQFENARNDSRTENIHSQQYHGN